MLDIIVGIAGLAVIACSMLIKDFAKMLICLTFVGFVIWYILIPGFVNMFR